MSNNTNTLFWIITGAVIVLSIFLLINNSQSNTLKSINTKFDSLWTGEKYENPNELIYSEDYKNNSNRFYCKINGNEVTEQGIHVKVTYIKVDQSTYNIFKWIVTNNSGKVLYNKYIRLEIYDCETDNKIFGTSWPENRFEVNEVIDLTTTTSYINQDEWKYYLKLFIDDEYVG